MPNYARIDNGVAAEVIGYDPAGLYHPSLVWVACPDDVAQGWQYDGTGWTPPTVTPPSEPDPTGETYAAAQLQAAKDAACARIEAARIACEQAGVTISWPDGTSSKIQTRDERDWRNINGVASRGLARLTQGSTDEDWFRDADNVDHTLTPPQALDMGYQASAAISAVARVAQDTKDAINADTVVTIAGIAEIEAAVVWPS